MAYSFYPGLLGDMSQQDQLATAAALHDIGEEAFGSPPQASGASKPQGGQNPKTGDPTLNAGRTARNSQEAGASDAAEDVNHNAKPKPIEDPLKNCGCSTCPPCPKCVRPVPGQWSQHEGFWWRPRHGRTPLHPLPPGRDGAVVDVSGEVAIKEPAGGSTIVKTAHLHLQNRPLTIYQDGVPTNPQGFGNDGTHSLFWFNGDQMASVFTIDYSYQESTASDPVAFLRIEDYEGSSDARDHAVNFRGLVLRGQKDQKVAALRAHYESEGFVYQVINDSETITVVSSDPSPASTQLPGFALQLSFPPVSPIGYSDVDTNWSLSAPLDNYREWLVEDGALLQAVAPHISDALFTYLIKYEYDSYHFENFTADGSTNVFYPDGGPRLYGTWLGDVLGPSIEIESVVEVSIDGDPDPDPTFDGDKVILSVTPTAGQSVDIVVARFTLRDQWEAIPNPGGEFSYTLSPEDEIVKILVLCIQDYDVTEYAQRDGNVVRTLRPFYVGNEATVHYRREQAIGDKYSITGMTIYEKDPLSGELRVLECPIPPADANPPNPNNDNVPSRNNFPDAHYGYLFEDATFDCYTIVGPNGLIWRSRKKLTEALPEGTPFHATLSAYPDEANSTDLSLVDQGKTRNRRPHPWLGMSVAGPYALQGSWNRVGGYRGDSDFVLRFWTRDPASRVWVNLAETSVKELCGDHSGGSPLKVCPSGMTDLFNVVSPGSTSLNQTWPASRNRTSWIVGAGWIEHNFQNDWDGIRDPEQLGWEDAGLTINALSCETGEVLASLTLRSDPEDIINQYVDSSAQVNAELALGPTEGYLGQIIDKYYNNNPIYYPPLSGTDPAPPWAGQIIWNQDRRYGEYPQGGGLWWLFYKITSIANEIVPIRNRPGLPSFSSSAEARRWINHEGDDSRADNRADAPDFVLDEDNNIYATLWMPCWLRLQDEFADKPYEYLEGEAVEVLPAVTGAYTASYLVSVWFGRLISSIRYSTFNDVPGEVYIGSFYTGWAELFNRVVFYRNGVYAGQDENGYSLFDYPELTVKVGWSAVVPRDSRITSTSVYSPTNGFEFGTWAGFQGSPQPYQGFKIMTWAADRKEVYATTARQVLVKLHYDEQTQALAEVWRKDITQFESTRTSTDEPERAQTPYQGQCHHTIAVGRYILVLRRLRDTPDEPDQYSAGGVSSLFLEVYQNGPTEPELVHSIKIPQTTGTNIRTLQMTADLDPQRKEFVLLNFVQVVSSSWAGEVLARWSTLIRLGDTPEVVSVQQGAQEPQPFPNPGDSDFNGLARSKGQYYWLDRQMTVYQRKISS